MRPVIVLLVAMLAGCAPDNHIFEILFVLPRTCPTEKIQFVQADGCLNDGSFEFCVANDDDLLAVLYQSVPNMTCIRAGGRARCDLQTQVLCLVATNGLCQPNQPRALTDAGWELACNIASRPYIERLVATWYE